TNPTRKRGRPSLTRRVSVLARTFSTMRAVCLATVGLILAAVVTCHRTGYAHLATTDEKPSVSDRSPVDLALSPDERWLWTVNQTANSVSLVEIASEKTVAEIACGQRPSA